MACKMTHRVSPHPADEPYYWSPFPFPLLGGPAGVKDSVKRRTEKYSVHVHPGRGGKSDVSLTAISDDPGPPDNPWRLGPHTPRLSSPSVGAAKTCRCLPGAHSGQSRCRDRTLGKPAALKHGLTAVFGRPRSTYQSPPSRRKSTPVGGPKGESRAESGMAGWGGS